MTQGMVLASFFSQPVVWSTSLVELLTVIGLFSLIGGLYKHWECHVRTCHRPGHAVQGTSHRACWKHHPHLHKGLTADDIAHAAKVAQGIAPPDGSTTSPGVTPASSN
jgi:hypothetical protein